MGSKRTSETVGVIGAGRFGIVIANILANKQKVLLYTRTAEKAALIQKTRILYAQKVHSSVEPTTDLARLAHACVVIFPVLPSHALRETMRQLSPYLKGHHILIHGTKGLDIGRHEKMLGKSTLQALSKHEVKTMSQVIREETPVIRLGCLSGPNLAQEIGEGKPAATLIASRFDEVVHEGDRLLRSPHFLVYGSKDLIGVELSGVLKNVIAIGAGIIDELGLGHNAKALLISRGILDMLQIGHILGAKSKSFLGLSGVGDVVVSCYTPLSRNFRVGQQLAQKKPIASIVHALEETAEGVRTVEIVVRLAKKYKVRCILAELLHKIIHQKISIEDASTLLMKLPFQYDMDNVFDEA